MVQQSAHDDWILVEPSESDLLQQSTTECPFDHGSSASMEAWILVQPSACTMEEGEPPPSAGDVEPLGEPTPSEGDAEPLESAEQACVKDAKLDILCLDECGIYCEACGMWLNGKVQWEDHLIGRKHRKNTGKLAEKIAEKKMNFLVNGHV